MTQSTQQTQESTVKQLTDRLHNREGDLDAINILNKAFDATRIQDVEATRIVNSAIGYLKHMRY